MTENIPVSDVPIEPAPDSRRFRRLVTGIREDGRSAVLVDEVSPHRDAIANTPTFVQTEFWKHESVPVDNSGPVDDGVGSPPYQIAPPQGGSVFRVLAFPPDSHWDSREGYTDRMLHATPSLDYAIVLDGEIWSVMDDDEVLMGPGDVLVQRGTNHRWSNRSDGVVHVYFVLIGGTAQ